jgi:hypothetical protein
MNWGNLLVILFLGFIVASCIRTYDNPRNMENMTAEEIERELSE